MPGRAGSGSLKNRGECRARGRHHQLESVPHGPELWHQHTRLPAAECWRSRSVGAREPFSVPMTARSGDGRADATRRQILRAASHQFARRAYHDVGLDNIVAEAEMTKGSIYFHFKSKYALAI